MFKKIICSTLVMFFSFNVSSYAAEIELRLAHANAPTEDSVFQVNAVKFKELIEKYSNGNITVTIFPSGQIGSEEELVTFVKEGSVDLACASLNQVSNHAPGLDALYLPYMFESSKELQNVLNKMTDYYNDYLAKRANMRLASVVTMGDNGFRQLLTLEPIRSLDDMKKLKLRVPANPVMTAAFQSFGIEPTPISWGELFNAMQTGVVDGFECDVTVLVSARYNEVVKYITDINYLSQISLMVLSNSTYQRLSEENKAIVDRAIKETNEYMLVKGAELGQHCIDVSTKVEFLGKPTDYDQWVEKGKAIWPQFYKRIGDGNESAGKALAEKVYAAAKGK